jgi:cyclopropane-fatty-acyl-phospholipid synthase
MFSSLSELTLGEAYIYDDFDIQGDIEAAFDLADYLLTHERGPGKSFDLNARLGKLPESDRPRRDLRLVEFSGKVHTKDRDRQVISHHYDLPTEFYALWLDERMVYWCTPVPTSVSWMRIWILPRNASSITSAGSCDCARESDFWILAAVGVG